jgi:hypothetical protein
MLPRVVTNRVIFDGEEYEIIILDYTRNTATLRHTDRGHIVSVRVEDFYVQLIGTRYEPSNN